MLSAFRIDLEKKSGEFLPYAKYVEAPDTTTASSMFVVEQLGYTPVDLKRFDRRTIRAQFADLLHCMGCTGKVCVRETAGKELAIGRAVWGLHRPCSALRKRNLYEEFK